MKGHPFKRMTADSLIVINCIIDLKNEVITIE